MFKEMRRSDKMLSNEEMFNIMKNTEFGVLSTIGEDGFPYGVPVNFVYDNNSIYFHCGLKGHKLDNIKFNSKVSFCIICDVELIPDDFNTKFKSVIAFGEVREIPLEEKNKVYRLLLEKFSKDFIEPGIEYVKKSGNSAKIFKIDIMHMTAKGKK